MRRSVGPAVTVGIVLVVLAVVLAVGWHVLVVVDLRSVARRLQGLHVLLLVMGTVLFLLLISGLVLLCAWLVREMRLGQRQRAFLDAVTHEMRTPLASLRLYLETLGRHQLTPERRIEFLGRMREELERLERSVEQILLAARAERGGGRAPEGTVDIVPLLESCLAEVRQRYRLEPEALRLAAGSRPHVRGDAEELRLVFRNLLDNAVKYSRERIDVSVRVQEEHEGRVQVEIRDRGVGIPRRELRRIFQPFYRAGLDVQRRVAGLGLGLFIVRFLVRRQGGRVRAHSSGVGQGSRFEIELRGARETAQAPLPRSVEAHAPNPRG